MLIRAVQEEPLMFKPQPRREHFSLTEASGRSVLFNVSPSAVLMSL